MKCCFYKHIYHKYEFCNTQVKLHTHTQRHIHTQAHAYIMDFLIHFYAFKGYYNRSSYLNLFIFIFTLKIITSVDMHICEISKRKMQGNSTWTDKQNTHYVKENSKNSTSIYINIYTCVCTHSGKKHVNFEFQNIERCITQ